MSPKLEDTERTYFFERYVRTLTDSSVPFRGLSSRLLGLGPRPNSLLKRGTLTPSALSAPRFSRFLALVTHARSSDQTAMKQTFYKQDYTYDYNVMSLLFNNIGTYIT